MYDDIRSLNHSDEPDSAHAPIWRPIVFQAAGLAGFTLLLVLAGASISAVAPREFQGETAWALVALPLALWLFLSLRPEFRVARPRRPLLGVAVASALLASAIGLPLLEDFFRVDQWLPLESVVQRLIGYSLTAGMIDACLKFLALRYIVYPQSFRQRGDAVVYAFAGALGYSLVMSLMSIARIQPTWDTAAITLLTHFTAQVASSLFIALGLAESCFGDAYPLTLPLHVVAAALFTGLALTLAGGLQSGTLTTAGAFDRPLFALGALVAVLFLCLSLTYFLYNNSERREREAYPGGGRDGI